MSLRALVPAELYRPEHVSTRRRPKVPDETILIKCTRVRCSGRTKRRCIADAGIYDVITSERDTEFVDPEWQESCSGSN